MNLVCHHTLKYQVPFGTNMLLILCQVEVLIHFSIMTLSQSSFMSLISIFFNRHVFIYPIVIFISLISFISLIIFLFLVIKNVWLGQKIFLMALKVFYRPGIYFINCQLCLTAQRRFPAQKKQINEVWSLGMWISNLIRKVRLRIKRKKHHPMLK